MSEESEKSFWSIRAMPAKYKEMATGAASRRGVTLPAWLSQAIEDRTALEAEDRVILPGETKAVERHTPAISPSIPIADILALAQAEKLTAEASGIPTTKSNANHLRMLIQSHARAARGLPPLKVRTPPELPHRTIEHDGQQRRGRLGHG